ncbi:MULTISPECIES: hypothetical protein [Acinetobacter]|uniref:hypothetical protein n=1 Tax=Acinetobacter TaxID=469 RepID=UPI0002AE9B39|nr:MULTISPECIES: hypothetical protein [Acinetobacter]ATZ62943.1 hypothetical protein BSR55_06120 [Acinetobacter bereziniae]ELW90929.1 hypothetical protein ACINWC743_1808 [Acinetobacter sp. WC-743]MBJ9373343.1 hypothetical protein [Acinetobacter sp. TGL-Y2]BCX74653.1 hypothetical protein TOL5_28530 [Acinetobacter sp. Tol 5]
MSNKTYLGSVNRETRPFNLDIEKLRRANAKVTAATAYKAGDLLVLSDSNVVTHATDEKTWNVVCGQDVTAQQATQMAADGIEIPIYFGGVFSIEAVRIAGEYLEVSKYDSARAKATLNNIEFSKV